MHATATLPPQCHCVVTALLDKTETSDRPITVLSNVYRALAAAQGEQTKRWEAATAGPWDMAKAGAGALMGAWTTELEFEVARHTGLEAAGVLCDVEKFYDGIGWDLLLEDLQTLQFPMHLALITLRQCMTPRCVAKYQAHSEFFTVSNSILAGCARAIALVRAYLYEVCHTLHTTFPDAVFRQYVDDLVLAILGST